MSLNSYENTVAGAQELAEPPKQHQGTVTTRHTLSMHVGRVTLSPQKLHTDEEPVQQPNTDHHSGHSMSVKRRDLLWGLSLALSAGSWVQPAQAVAQPLSPVALAAFRAALNTSGSSFEVGWAWAA